MTTTPARAIGAAIEAFTGQVYFSPECHTRYAALGFAPSGAEVRGVAMPDGPAYFCSRGSLMGQVPADLIAAAFAVFNPDAVAAAVAHGWSLTDATTICAERTAGAIEQLERILGPEPEGIGRALELVERAAADLRPEGRPLYAGTRSQPRPPTTLGATWWLADQLREYRGDVHTAAWTTAGVDATEMGLLTELYWGLPMRSYSRTRAWTDDQFDAAEARLAARGLVDAGALTAAGLAFREDIEIATDRGCQPIVDALGDDLDEFCDLMNGWSQTIRAAFGYPASGPHDLAGERANG
ncbi:MAG: hypothetical protein R2733_00580 [Acidimicrobiales bacterium]